MTHETNPVAHEELRDNDFTDTAVASPPTKPVTAQTRLEMNLPVKENSPEGEERFTILDRVKQWEEQFKRSAAQALKEVYGYTDATVVDFRWLGMDAGHDENDYELKVQIGSSLGGDVGSEEVSVVPIIVRRAEQPSLQS